MLSKKYTTKKMSFWVQRRTRWKGGYGKSLKSLLVTSAFISIATTAPAIAEYDGALKSYAAGDYNQAIDLWKTDARSGDVRSRQVLGDVYSGEAIELHPTDRDLLGFRQGQTLTPPNEIDALQANYVEALTWYMLAAFHDFETYNQEPTWLDITAKARAQERVHTIMSLMSTKQVRRSQKNLDEIISSSASSYDLYRLGLLYLRGQGVSKNNRKAYQYFTLATDKNRNNFNDKAVRALQDLETIMSVDDRDKARKLAADWQPPQHPFTVGMTGTEQLKDEQAKRAKAERLALVLLRLRELDDDLHLFQSALNSLGMRAGDEDNIEGRQTRAAIRRFQKLLYQNEDNMSEEQKADRITGSLSYPQTLALFEQAAERGDYKSQWVWGVMHAEAVGLEPSAQQAIYWLKKSAGLNFSLAHYSLGEYYRDGIPTYEGLEPNRSLALFHFSRAAVLGYKPGKIEARKIQDELYDDTSLNDTQ